MKVITILSLFLLTATAFGQLTREDLRAVIREENAALEKRLKEYIDLKIETVNARIDAVDQRIDATNARIDDLDKSLNARIDDIRIVMIALVGLIAAAVALPQIIIAYIERKREKEVQLLLQQLRDKNSPSPPSS